DGSNASRGQSSPTPSQLSAMSHGPADGRQTAVLLASAGQKALVPLHVSAGSHTPAEGRHSIAAGTKVSGGQSSCMPSHVSATSHGPAACRHSVPLGFGSHPLCGSQAKHGPSQARGAPPTQLPLPSQWSSVVQAFPSSHGEPSRSSAHPFGSHSGVGPETR